MGCAKLPSGGKNTNEVSKSMNELNIRQLRLSDFFVLHRICDSFSENDKRFFYPSWCSKHILKPKEVIKWFIAQIALFLSLTPLRKFISRFYLRGGAPLLVNQFVWRASLLLIGAFDHQKISLVLLFSSVRMIVKSLVWVLRL